MGSIHCPDFGYAFGGFGPPGQIVGSEDSEVGTGRIVDNLANIWIGVVVGACWTVKAALGWKLGSGNLFPGRLGNSGPGS